VWHIWTLSGFPLYADIFQGNISTGIDPNKENMIRFQRYSTQDLKPGNRETRNFLEHHITARVFLSLLAIFGVSLIISDGILTPAQSVLGAIQGMTLPIREPSLLTLLGLDVIKPDIGNSTVVGITCAILVLLYAIQPFGVERLSIVFAPIVIVWLLFNFTFGIYVSSALSALTELNSPEPCEIRSFRPKGIFPFLCGRIFRSE
jgi:KUP system potassium uptake protein